MKKYSDLQKLSGALERLITILRRDPKCQWVQAFADNLEFCRHLLAHGFVDSDLISLSSSIRSVFQGSGSFNDYAPGIYDRNTGKYSPITGTDSFLETVEEVYTLANELRTITSNK